MSELKPCRECDFYHDGGLCPLLSNFDEYVYVEKEDTCDQWTERKTGG